MSDYQETSTNDDFDEDDDSLVDDEETQLDDGVPSDNLADYQQKILTREEIYHKLYHDTYKTPTYMTKYIRTKLLGVRAHMLAEGAPSLVDFGDETDPVEIAKMELRQKKLPLLALIYLPSKNPKKPHVEVRKATDLHTKI